MDGGHPINLGNKKDSITFTAKAGDTVKVWYDVGSGNSGATIYTDRAAEIKSGATVLAGINDRTNVDVEGVETAKQRHFMVSATVPAAGEITIGFNTTGKVNIYRVEVIEAN